MKERKVNSLLKQFNAALIQYEKENTENLGVTPAQSVLLWHLLVCGEKEIYLSEVCRKAELSKATISAALKALRKNGYLVMKADVKDDRKRKIVLTERAYKAQERIEKSLKKRMTCIYRGISEQELEILESLLERMIFNLKQEAKTSYKEE